MSLAAVRTSAVAILAVAVAVRVSLSQPPAGVLARIAADPAGWLAASTSGWTSAGTLGDATAQGLRDIPVALFVRLGDVLTMSAEAIQATWYVLVTLLALLGALRVVGDRSWTAHVAAIVYACGPVLLATLTHSPSDGFVVALLPWIVAPLASRPPGWRDVAVSAAFLGAAGVGSPPWAVSAAIVGVVAAATSARVSVVHLARWVLLAALASAWWVAVLVWEGLHARSLTELVPETTFLDAGRAALDGAGWSAGWFALAASAPLAVAAAALVLRIRWPGRALTAALLALGVLAAVAHLVGLGDLVPVTGSTGETPALLVLLMACVAISGLVAWTPLAHELRDRFSAGPRLPRAVPRTGSEAARAVRRGLPALIAAALVAATFLGFVLAAHERTDPAPAATGLWDQVSRWSEEAPPGRVLVLPPVDGPLEPVVAAALGSRPWIARDSTPLSGAAATTALDDAVRRLSRGLGGPGTQSALERLGIAYVIVRNDLPVEADRTRPAALLRHALMSQGASRAAVFSAADPVVSWLPEGAVNDFGVRSLGQSLEIWSTGQGSVAQLYDEQPLVAAGDPGTAADLADAGLTGWPVVIAGQGAAEVDLVSDSPRRRDIDQREPLEPFGPYLTAREEPRTHPPGADSSATATRRLTGVRSVDASSSSADLGARPPRPGADPGAPLDGSPFTSWQAGRVETGEWWEVEFLRPTNLSSAELQIAQNPFAGAVVTQVRLEYDGGATEVDVPPAGLIGLTAATGTTRLRVVVTEFAGDSPTAGFSIAELFVPKLSVRDELVVDGPPTDTWMFAARPGSRANCVPAPPSPVDDDPAREVPVACNGGMSVSGPDTGAIDRVLETDEPLEVGGRVWMRAAESKGTAALAEEVARPSVVATGSSTAVPDLVTRPQAAADDDVTTSWRPAPDDLLPTLTLSWERVTRIRGVRLISAPDDPASVPTRVRVQGAADDGTAADEGQEVDVRQDGTVRIDPVRTDQLTVTVLEDDGLVSVDTFTGGLRQLPVAIAETELLGGPAVEYDGTRVASLPCGSGPEVQIGEQQVATSLDVSADDIVQGVVVQGLLCDRVELPNGSTRIKVQPSFGWAPLGLVLSPTDGPFGAVDREISTSVGAPGPTVALDADSDPADLTRIELPGDATGGTLVLAVPAGTGWTARADGDSLEPVTVDGWAQGWVVPAEADEVVLDYPPVLSLRWAVGVGLVGWVAVVALTALVSRGWKRRRDQAIVGRSTQS